MEDIAQHNRKYWQYEYDVAARYMVPLLTRWGVSLENADVIDVGCGEGGGICAIHDRGARCAGFDIDAHRVAVADQLKGDRAVRFTTGNLYAETLPFNDRQFDLAVMHDVFEHLEHKENVLERLAGFLRPHGRLMITFPPYFSAFGAHQQLLQTPVVRLPFVHLVPGALSVLLPRLKREHPHFVEEVRKLRRLKMGMRAFERTIAGSRFSIEHSTAYLISPNHIRFGLRPLAAGPIARIPLLNELLCSGVVYLLTRKG